MNDELETAIRELFEEMSIPTTRCSVCGNYQQDVRETSSGMDFCWDCLKSEVEAALLSQQDIKARARAITDEL